DDRDGERELVQASSEPRPGRNDRGLGLGLGLPWGGTQWPTVVLSGGAYVGGLWTLGPVDHVELDLLVLVEVAEPLALDGAEVDEHVGSVRAGDEPVPLLLAEPLHGAGGHAVPSFQPSPGPGARPPPVSGSTPGEGTARSHNREAEPRAEPSSGTLHGRTVPRASRARRPGRRRARPSEAATGDGPAAAEPPPVRRQA